MNYQDIRRTMKVGFMGSDYRPPVPMPDPEKGRWLIREAAAMGCDCLHYSVDFPETEEELSAIRALTDEYGVELELRGAEMGRLRNVFELTGPDAAQARADIAQRIRIMKRLGSRILRLGYGSLRIEKSRFAPDGRKQLETVGRSLREAAKIMEDNDVYLAVENHCDFLGSELAAMFESVDSPHVGCALDTANAYTVFNDPDTEIVQLAPYAVTTHIKDMLVVQEDVKGRIPFMPVGVAVGDGSVDIPRAIETLVRKARHPEGLHLVVEMSWVRHDPDDTPEQRTEKVNGMIRRSVAYLQDYIGRA
ncbi:MAG: sugar phosphate isomerase/epimerase [Clostridia bacterium]|nr:sugar phosphate isomerase/epimerase [Clostridia bacterium]